MLMLVLLTIFLALLAYRNQKTYKLRISMVRKIATFDDPLWRYDVLNSVHYFTMASEFWRPLTIEEFYPDTAFLTHRTVR